MAIASPTMNKKGKWYGLSDNWECNFYAERINMNGLYDEALGVMDQTFERLVQMVPQPKRVEIDKDFRPYRYVEKTIRQAIVQKLARIISGLRATRLLMEKGFAQEQASLQRMLDEFVEDVMFLAYAVIYKDVTELHDRYLEAFYEEIDIGKNRRMIPRKRIRAYLMSYADLGEQQEEIRQAGRMLSKIYSDYLHAASPQIMDMYFGRSPEFHTNGVRGTIMHAEYSDMFVSHIFRCIHSFAWASRAFGENVAFLDVRNYANLFGRQAGLD